MAIVLDGTTGITTPDMTSDGGLTADGVSFASGAPANTLVTTSTGNVGIGTSSPADKLEVAGAIRVSGSGSASADNAQFYNASGFGPTINGYNFAIRTGAGTTSERMRIDSSGNLLVGTTSNPNSPKFRVNGIAAFGGSNTNIYQGELSSTATYIQSLTVGGSAADLVFYNSSERMRIDSSGNLLVGTTSVNGKFAVTGAAGGSTAWFSTAGVGAHCIVGFQSHNAAGYDVKIYMECPGSNLGGFTYQRSTSRLYAWNSTENSGPYVIANGTSWTTNSDERLKTDIADISYGLNAVLALSPKQYKYKTGNKTSLGLIAQQTASVIPEIVDVPEDPELMMGIEYTGLIPVLVKAIQEQQAIIEQLRADVAVLKAKA